MAYASNHEGGNVSRSPWYHYVRIGFVLLSFAAVTTQLVLMLDRPNSNIANFFSFFTIQSNIIAAFVLLASGVMGLRGKASSRRWDVVRGGAVSWMATTGIVFAALLSGMDVDLQLTEPWVDVVLHQVMPLVMVADWLLAPPRHRLTVRSGLVWILYPAVYAAYSLVRGPMVDWYPYPFLDPRGDGGYAEVAAYSAGIAVMFVVLIWLVVALGNAARRFWKTSSMESWR